MALIRFGPAVAGASGSIGGTVFSHNRGGAYMRSRVVPVKVENTFTQEARDAMTNCSRLWAGLDYPQREAWREYAAANPVINRLGESKTLSGHVIFNRINTRLLQQGVVTIDLPPAAAPPDPLLTLSATVAAGAGTASVVFTATPAGAHKAVWVWACVLPSPGVNYVANRWRLVTKSAVNAASPLDIADDWTERFGSFIAGQVFQIRAQVLDTQTGLVSGYLHTGGAVSA